MSCFYHKLQASDSVKLFFMTPETLKIRDVYQDNFHLFDSVRINKFMKIECKKLTKLMCGEIA